MAPSSSFVFNYLGMPCNGIVFKPSINYNGTAKVLLASAAHCYVYPTEQMREYTYIYPGHRTNISFAMQGGSVTATVVFAELKEFTADLVILELDMSYNDFGKSFPNILIPELAQRANIGYAGDLYSPFYMKKLSGQFTYKPSEVTHSGYGTNILAMSLDVLGPDHGYTLANASGSPILDASNSIVGVLSRGNRGVSVPSSHIMLISDLTQVNNCIDSSGRFDSNVAGCLYGSGASTQSTQQPVQNAVGATQAQGAILPFPAINPFPATPPPNPHLNN